MIDSIRWWLSFRHNANFWDWLKDTYSLNELKKLTVESTDASLINPFNPLDDPTQNQHEYGEVLRRRTVCRLMKRYGTEIWSICLGAGDYSPETGKTGIFCLTGLALAFQVYNQTTFEEFLVRNAIKYAAQKIIRKNAENEDNQKTMQ